MDTGNRPSVVHESEVQRQHPRIRIPATLSIEGNRGGQTVRVLDVSAGGFAYQAKQKVEIGQRQQGRLTFIIEGVTLGLPVAFEVRHHDPASGRTGCRFDGLGPAEISALRQLIGAHLAGELVTVGEVLATASRDSYLRPRAAPALAPVRRGFLAQLRALTFTTLMFMAGIAAFAYTAYKLYAVVFVTEASAAKVAAPSYTIAMPRDGTFFSLVPDDGIVHKGQPLGSFQAAMLDVLQGDPGTMHLSPDQLSKLMGETLRGTVSSPCDCKVLRQYAIDSQYINRNQPLMELIPVDARPYVLARFHFETMDRLTPGRTVRMKISGHSGYETGTIRHLRLLPSAANPVESGGSSDLRGLDGSGAVSDVLAEIEPKQPIDPALLDRPVVVSLGDPRSSDFNFERLRALLPGAAAR